MNGLIDSVFLMLSVVLLYRLFVWFAAQEDARRSRGDAPRRWWWTHALPYMGTVLGLIFLVGWWRTVGGSWVTPPATFEAWATEHRWARRYQGAAIAAAAVILFVRLAHERRVIEQAFWGGVGRSWIAPWWVVGAAGGAAGAAWWALG